ncbi:MAG: hypothetical protein HON98_06305 [Chloroflexi bacterium]|nr:hypothetical protein [Chloroflexota bacterium]MBT3669489.1 hypothetical protein [Chloroflexota bacterium]MBT4003647.1 hypothetical protein [Chloroflexota bacterium]MBT4304492.1 hypothetical protein [Chloroflexota bacterium]MBT4534167.1 hypothetical protein [Chloroflexota bacterium]
MNQLILWSSFLFIFLSQNFSGSALQQAEYEIKLISPIPGSAVQGLVEIVGTTKTDAFEDFDISFSLITDPSETWFPIIHSQKIIDEDTLAEWDTSSLTDGSYAIRLIVNLTDQEPIIIIHEDIRVRNYSPIETSTPEPTQADSPDQPPTATVTSIPPTATNIPENPAQIDKPEINSALTWGITITILSLLLLGLYTSLKQR